MQRRIKGLLLLLLVLASGASLAAQGNPKAGQKKIAVCLGCHGIEDYKTSYPTTYHVPKLGGQHPDYLVKALQGYKTGTRKHPSMTALVETLSDQDMADIAAYFGGLK